MAEIYQDPDENVGETFLSTDTRYDNRRIKILGILANHEVRGPLYRYVVLTDDGQATVVGRRGKLSFQTLKREYRRVSK